MGDKDVIEFKGELYKKNAFMMEEDHPAIGRILIVNDVKFKILDGKEVGEARAGTFITELTEEDEAEMKAFDKALEILSEKLSKKVNVKRMVKEAIKNKPFQEIKTGLWILEQEDKGETIEEEHHRGCYAYKIFHKNQGFELFSTDAVQRDE